MRLSANKKFIFDDLANVNSQLNKYIDSLYEESALRVVESSPLDTTERVKNVTDLTEAYFEFVGNHAPSQYLERLSNYLMYDYLTSKLPNKKDAENPVLSKYQKIARDRFLMFVPSVKDPSGHVGSKSTNTITARDKRYKIFDYKDGNIETLTLFMDLENLLNRANLTEREKTAVQGILIMQESARSLAEKLGKTHPTVSSDLKKALEKLRQDDSIWQEFNNGY